MSLFKLVLEKGNPKPENGRFTESTTYIII